MNSDFCEPQAMVKLVSFGMYSTAVIKKRQYGPKYIDGGDIDSHIDLKEVGQTNSLTCTFYGTNLKCYA